MYRPGRAIKRETFRFVARRTLVIKRIRPPVIEPESSVAFFLSFYCFPSFYCRPSRAFPFVHPLFSFSLLFFLLLSILGVFLNCEEPLLREESVGGVPSVGMLIFFSTPSLTGHPIFRPRFKRRDVFMSSRRHHPRLK